MKTVPTSFQTCRNRSCRVIGSESKSHRIDGLPSRASLNPARTAKKIATPGCIKRRNHMGPPQRPTRFSQPRASASSNMIWWFPGRVVKGLRLIIRSSHHSGHLVGVFLDLMGKERPEKCAIRSHRRPIDRSNQAEMLSAPVRLKLVPFVGSTDCNQGWMWRANRPRGRLGWDIVGRLIGSPAERSGRNGALGTTPDRSRSAPRLKNRAC